MSCCCGNFVTRSLDRCIRNSRGDRCDSDLMTLDRFLKPGLRKQREWTFSDKMTPQRIEFSGARVMLSSCIISIYSCMITSSPGAAGACSLPSAVWASPAAGAAGAGASSLGPSSSPPRLLLQARSIPSTLSFSHTRKLPRFAGPEIDRFSISAEAGPMMAMEVLEIERCLSCWRVSCRAERPWLIRVGRSAN